MILIFGNIQNYVTSFVNDNKNNFQFWNIKNEENSSNNDNFVLNQTINNTQINEIENKIEETNIIGGIGGAESNEIIEEEIKEEKEDKSSGEETKKNQNELDIEYLKTNYSFIKPVTGVVTSNYGKREETEVVSANHQGIDIGTNEGTAIYASMEGVVTVASSEGEYGKHIDIMNGDVLTRYAHCSKLLVEVGQKVEQGEKIAEVGSTGNSTGPHLHFEIRRDDRTINPALIIDFK